MKNFLFIFALVPVLAMGTPKVGSTLEDAELSPGAQEPQMPGTSVPLDAVNTSPNPTPEGTSNYGDTLSTGSYGEKKTSGDRRYPAHEKKQPKQKTKKDTL